MIQFLGIAVLILCLAVFGIAAVKFIKMLDNKTGDKKDEE